MLASIRRFLDEPRPLGAPHRVWRDTALVIFFLAAVTIDVTLKDVPWKPAFYVVMLPLPFALLFRRSHPLHAVAAFIVPLTLLDIALAVGDQPLPDLPSLAFALILIYAAFRWGSGGEAIWAAIILMAGASVDALIGFASFGDTIAGFVIIALVAETGIVIRRNGNIREALSLNARSQERERLARELHDTVAHHVSAIAVQAQAGRAVMDVSPDKADAAFRAIEESASRALGEMRLVVDALRNEAPYAPSRTLADLDELVEGVGPAIEITRDGDFTNVAPPVSAALYRIAQESITNARRHSIKATKITMLLKADAEHVRLRVSNDGSPASERSDYNGFGLMGMEERATLLGGTFKSGPLASGGWFTFTELPRTGVHQSRPATARQSL